jgi:hypothetical protein
VDAAIAEINAKFGVGMTYSAKGNNSTTTAVRIDPRPYRQRSVIGIYGQTVDGDQPDPARNGVRANVGNPGWVTT